MNKISISGVCTPLEIIYDKERKIIGYTMEKAHGNTLSEVIFTPNKLKSTFPDWTRIELTRLANNILKIISQLHSNDILIGNFNTDNIFFTSPDDIYIVGTDSFQVKDYLSMEGADNIEYLSPYAQGRDVYTYKRNLNDELFAISVLLFKIYLTGRHPFYNPSLDKMKEKKMKLDFSYTPHEEDNINDENDEWTKMWYDLPFELRIVFYNSFKKGQLMPLEVWHNSILPAYLQQLELFEVTRNIFPSNVSFIIRDKSLNMNKRDIVESRDKNLRIIKTEIHANEGTSKIAVLELSTRAVKILIGRNQENIKNSPFNFKMFYREASKTNTGRGLNSANIMDMDYFRRNVLPSIIKFKEIAEIQGVEFLYTVATAAYRTANNRDEIVECIRKEAGVNVCILSQEEEASATIMAFRHTTKDVEKLKAAKYLMLIDAGGGSSEVSLFEGNTLLSAHSTNLGTEALRNAFFSTSTQNTTLEQAFKIADNKTRERLLTWDRHMGDIVRESKPLYCIAVGSAITKATGKSGNSKQHGTNMKLFELYFKAEEAEKYLARQYQSTKQLFRALNHNYGRQLEMIESDFVQRLGIPVYANIMEMSDIDELTVSGTGLWYGIYFQKLMEKENEEVKEQFYNL